MILTATKKLTSEKINILINKIIVKNERILAFAKTQERNGLVSIKLLRSILGYSYKTAMYPLCKNFLEKNECTCDGYEQVCPLYVNHLTGCKVSYFPEGIDNTMTWEELINLEECLIADLKSINIT